ncbi:isopeptide-forming domain-containing fimbrial protein [Bacillus cereus]|uniref:isopeptide-forming domain-containing fimbrial protein n=1 Tax=Bacillus cereus TaxID=1396 RepID=UPI003D173BA6
MKQRKTLPVMMAVLVASTVAMQPVVSYAVEKEVKTNIGVVNKVVDITTLTNQEKNELPNALFSSFKENIAKEVVTPIKDWDSNYKGTYKMDFVIPNDKELEPAKKYTYHLGFDVSKLTVRANSWIALEGLSGTEFEGKALGYYNIKRDGTVELIFTNEFTKLKDRKGFLNFNFSHSQVTKKVVYNDKETDSAEIIKGEHFDYEIKVKFDKNSISKGIDYNLEDYLDARVMDDLYVYAPNLRVEDQDGNDYTKYYRSNMWVFGGGNFLARTNPSIQNVDVRGKELTFTIPAKMGEDVSNDVVITDKSTFNGLKSNPVTVKPFVVKTPSITHDVEGKEHLDIEKGKTYKYNVNMKMPSKVTGIEKLILKETLNSNLNIVSAKTIVNGKEYTRVTPKINGQNVSVQFGYLDAFLVADKDVTLQIETSIKDNAPTNTIGSNGVILVNDNPIVNSNTVTVTPK